MVRAEKRPAEQAWRHKVARLQREPCAEPARSQQLLGVRRPGTGQAQSERTALQYSLS